MLILIIEDELLLARKLQKMIAAIYPEAETVYTNSINETVEWLSINKQPDLLLMDIELADGQSFEIFERVEIQSPVIFTTAYDEYALRAFKVNSIDYLLKPIKQDDLQRALDKLKVLRGTNGHGSIYKLMEKMRHANTEGFRERMLVKQGQKMISINSEDIGLFFAHNAVTFLVTKSKQKYIIDYTLDQLENLLDPKKFYRVNRQYILEYSTIVAVHQWFNGKLKIDINFNTNQPIIVSRDKATLVKKWLSS